MTKAAELAKILSGGAVFNEDSADVDFRVESNGNANMLVVDGGNDRVGIGTNSVSNTLEIKSATAADGIRLSNEVGSYYHLLRSNGDGLLFDADAGSTGGSGADIRFQVKGSEKARLDSSGNLLHSTTSTLNMGASNAEGFSLLSGGVLRVSADGQSSIHAGRISNFGSVVTFACAGTGDVGSIDVTTSATSYTTSSDYRLKENVVEMTDATTRLKKLQPKRFNFIADETNTLVDGFLAHEVSSIVPEAITGEKDAVDADGNIDPQGIDQSKLVPLLTKALQEQQATIEALTARITALEDAD